MSTIKDLMTAMKAVSAEKTKAYDTSATVKRIEGNTAWVHIPGGVDETPVKLTINAKEGDTVQVRVADGKAWLQGNATSPPTDDSAAREVATIAVTAAESADAAKRAALGAEADAERAKSAADAADAKAIAAGQAAATADAKAVAAGLSAAEADAKAVAAGQAADRAEGKADAAAVSAANASEYAARALGNLSTVQSVVETLTWITQHGTMTLTSDTALDPTHVYFVRDANGDYEVGSYRYSIVTEPDVTELSTYYELSIDESLNNYVATHLAVDSEGLWIIPDAGGNRVLISTGQGSLYPNAGTYIISGSAILAEFTSSGATIGDVLSAHTIVDDTGTHILDGRGNVLAAFGLNMRIGSENTANLFADSTGFTITDDDGTIVCYVNPDEFNVKSNKRIIKLDSEKLFFGFNEKHGFQIESGGSYTTTIGKHAGKVCMSTFNVQFAEGDSGGKTGSVYEPPWNDTGKAKFSLRAYNVDSGFVTEELDVTADTTGTMIVGNDSFVYSVILNTGQLTITPSSSVLSATQFVVNGFVSIEEKSTRSETYNVPSFTFGTRVSGETRGGYSLCVGENNIAKSGNANAFGRYLIARNYAKQTQTVFGKYNEEDVNEKYAIIIGNGTANDARSNALAVTWEGDIIMALDDYQTSGSDDKALYDAIVALGWQDVLES